MKLAQKKCAPCEGKIARMNAKESEALLKEVPSWKLQQDKLHKGFEFKDFIRAMKFVNEMAELAEQEAHHPDFCVHYNKVDVTIWTHAVEGLSENDFILAAKLDEIKLS